MEDFKVISSNSKLGRLMIKRHNKCNYFAMNEMQRSKPSAEKLEAYKRVSLAFLEDCYGCRFRVGNNNKFMFTATWFTIYNNELALRVEHKSGTYIVTDILEIIPSETYKEIVNLRFGAGKVVQ